MPSENKTPNIGLNQWQGNEYIKREDFNADNLAIDKAIKEIAEKVDNAEVPVESVNGQTGIVNLKAEHIKATDGTTLEKFKTDTISSLDKKMNKQILDDATTKKYGLGIKNGLLYYREVV